MHHACSTHSGSCQSEGWFGRSYTTAPFFQLPVRSVLREVFREGKYLLGIFAEKHIWQLWVFLGSFLRKKISFENGFSETNVIGLCTSFVLLEVKMIFGRFQVEALRAYACKEIVGLCHWPPWMEYQVMSGKKSSEEKNHPWLVTRTDWKVCSWCM